MKTLKVMLIGLFLSTIVNAGEILTLATGSKSGIYTKSGVIFAKTAYKTGLKVRVINSQGSVHNISLVKYGHKKYGKVELIIANPSVYDKFKSKVKLEKVGPLHTEYVHIVCNNNSGVNSIHDLESGEKILAVGFPGSDNKIIFENWQKEDSGYEATTTANIGGKYALEALLEGSVDCSMFTAGLGSKTMLEIDKQSTNLHIITIDDGDFNDYKDSNGKHPYFFADIPKNTYKNLQAGALWGSKPIETIAMQSVLYMNADLPEDVKKQIKTAYKLSIKKIQKKYGYVEK